MALEFGLAIMNDFPPGVVPASREAMMREQVREASRSGISSVWLLQHYLGSMPTLQPVPTLAALAQDAGEMTLGTNMFILPLRHPVEVAEEFANLDHLTGGRAVAGFGMGYRENEFESFGIPMGDRVGRYEESIAIIRDLWTGEPTTYDGEHFRIKDERISLAPVQPGGPPIWIGAGPHRTGALRAARLGDAWIVPPHVTPEKLATLLGHYRGERERLGKEASALVVRRELVLHDDAERARQIGLEARPRSRGRATSTSRAPMPRPRSPTPPTCSPTRPARSPRSRTSRPAGSPTSCCGCSGTTSVRSRCSPRCGSSATRCSRTSGDRSVVHN